MCTCTCIVRTVYHPIAYLYLTSNVASNYKYNSIKSPSHNNMYYTILLYVYHTGLRAVLCPVF